jgi:hypothetical protein
MNVFQHAIDDKPKKKLINKIGDDYNEESIIIILLY